jgi:hypothetical protein
VARLKSPPRIKPVVRGVDVVDVGQAGLVWARHDMIRDVCPAPEGDDGLPAVANEAVGGRAASATAIEAQSTFGNTVSTVAATRSRANRDDGEDQIAGS